MATSFTRIAAIQARLGLEADGIIGPVTLTAIERMLDRVLGEGAKAAGLTCSLVGLKSIVEFEIHSEAYYNRHLKHPVWPGGASGVTIGIGYDLGYHSPAQLRRDWRSHIADADIETLKKLCRMKADKARAKVGLASVKRITVPLDAARKVFYAASLPAYAAKCLKAYPGVERLPADAQSAMLSLVFNRGTAKSGSRRREMKALTALITAVDLDGIAGQLISMKRLWIDKGLDGLLVRRDRESALVRGAQRAYREDELVRI